MRILKDIKKIWVVENPLLEDLFPQVDEQDMKEEQRNKDIS